MTSGTPLPAAPNPAAMLEAGDEHSYSRTQAVLAGNGAKTCRVGGIGDSTVIRELDIQANVVDQRRLRICRVKLAVKANLACFAQGFLFGKCPV